MWPPLKYTCVWVITLERLIVTEGLTYLNKPATLGMYEVLLPPNLKGFKTICNILLKFAYHSQKASLVF